MIPDLLSYEYGYNESMKVYDLLFKCEKNFIEAYGRYNSAILKHPTGEIPLAELPKKPVKKEESSS